LPRKFHLALSCPRPFISERDEPGAPAAEGGVSPAHLLPLQGGVSDQQGRKILTRYNNEQINSLIKVENHVESWLHLCCICTNSQAPPSPR
jgi:hypothetical protein